MSVDVRFAEELKKNTNRPCVIFEVELDSGLKKFGTHAPFVDVIPIVSAFSSYQNKLDTKKGYTSRGEITFTIRGRENFLPLVRDEYLKNRRVTRKEGFLVEGFRYSNYTTTYSGIITDWSRNDDEFTITVSDDLIDATVKIPEENESNTQYIAYQTMNPADIMLDILKTRLGISDGQINIWKFSSEGRRWLRGWKLSRVITEPSAANDYLNELQQETNSYIVHDGRRISFKVYAPPLPGEAVEEWREEHLHNLTQRSGYKDQFYNRVVVWFDYDESGGDKSSAFESAVVATDTSSSDASQWDEASTKTIQSKWIRSLYIANPWNDQTITGIIIYHASKANGAGQGQLRYIKADNTLAWTAPGGIEGEPVEVSSDGRYDLYSSDKTKYIRVIVTTADLPMIDKTDYPNVTALRGRILAASIAQKILNFYRDPASTVSFDVDLNRSVYKYEFLKPTDLKDITTGEASDKGTSSWDKERVKITSVRPNIEKGMVAVEAQRAKMIRDYAFVGRARVGQKYIW